jgi:ABC-type multidrug transport system ATPase subunit
VDRISFEVSRNEIVGLLGPNGAGKTTTISMVLGVLQPDSGSIHIEGADLASHRAKALGEYELRRRLCSLAGEPDGAAESSRLWPALWGQRSVGADQRVGSPV